MLSLFVCNLVASQAELQGICRPLEGDCGVADARRENHPGCARRLALTSDRLGIYPTIQLDWLLREKLLK
jgi:hypothetical protein